MVNTDGITAKVASTYANAINKISEHYLKNTGSNVNIYQNRDIQVLEKICREYKRGGKFEDFGNKDNGLYRAAIKKYVCFFKETEDNINTNTNLNEEANFNAPIKGLLYVVYNEWINDPKTSEKAYKIGITKTSVTERYYGLGLVIPGEFETHLAYKIEDYAEA